MIFIEDFDLIIYTTLCPKTSLIFVSQSKKSSDFNAKSFFKKRSFKSNKKGVALDTEIFENKLLAKLDGHSTTNPPTICYVKESGYLVTKASK